MVRSFHNHPGSRWSYFTSSTAIREIPTFGTASLDSLMNRLAFLLFGVYKRNGNILCRIGGINGCDSARCRQGRRRSFKKAALIITGSTSPFTPVTANLLYLSTKSEEGAMPFPTAHPRFYSQFRPAHSTHFIPENTTAAIASSFLFEFTRTASHRRYTFWR